MIPFALVFGTAFILSLALTPLGARLGRRLEVVDQPGGRRIHARPTPRLGGIAVYLAFMGAVAVSLLVARKMVPPGPEGPDPNEMRRLTAVLAGSTFIFVAGLIDDRLDLPPLPQYATQLVAAGIAIAGLVFIERVNNPLTDTVQVFPWWVTIPLTLFWITGMVNTVNWLDGLDGLAAGVAAIASVVFSLHMIREGQYSVALLPLALLGATLGFLPFNFHPARVFLGSCGAFFLGYALGTISIVAGAKVASALLVLCVPILDVAWLIFSRMRRGASPMQGGRDHLHFRLLGLGLGQREVVLAYYVFCAAFGVMALLVSSRLYKLIALVLIAAVTTWFLWSLARSTQDDAKES